MPSPPAKSMRSKSIGNDAEADDTLSLENQLAELNGKYDSLKGLIGKLSKLGDTAVEMMNQDSLDNLLQFIANEIVNFTSANGAYLHMVHETGDYLHVVAACGALDEELLGQTRTRGVGLSAAAWESGTYQYTDDYNKWYGAEVVVFAQELKALSIPLSFSDEISGVAFITAPVDQDLYSEIPMLREIAKVASISIYYTKQLEAQANELQRIKVLSTLGEALYQSTDWENILETVSQHLFEIFDVERVNVYHDPDKNDTLKTYFAYRKSHENAALNVQTAETLSQHSISYWCFDNAKFAKIDRNVEDLRESSAVHAYRQKNAIGSTMCVPICFEKKPWGVFIITKNVNKRNFDENDANTFQAMASQLSTALQRNNLLSKVHHQAFHDSLTGLPNRRRFEEQFTELVNANESKENQDAYQEQERFAVMFCDLDGFKAVNDSHGHDVGDHVIKICTERMKNCAREGDLLARMGGDEFALMVKLKNHDYDIEILAKRFLDTICEPIHISNLRINIGVSIGISYYPKDGRKFSELLNHADVAMYQAKHSGKGKILAFNKSDADEIRYRNELRGLLQNALSNDEFELWHQPQVCWETGKVKGVEALIRWHSAERGMVSPFHFIPIAEESGLIEPLGLWIMEEAIRTLKNWNFSTDEHFGMSVNIAPPQFLDPDFSANVLGMLSKHNVPANQLKAEITESFIMQDRETVVTQLKLLRQAGVSVAVDDFGTGYSSLSYLQDLPIDVLKIDRSFVNSLTPSNFEKSIAASIIALANSQGLSTVAEGVETREQLDVIKQLGCNLVQGYYYSKPVPAAELPEVVTQIESMFVEFKKAA